MIKKHDHIVKNYSSVYFISDLHLGAAPKSDSDKREEILVNFLQIPEPGSALVIAGDLFDYWFEFRQVAQKGFFRTLAGLYDCKKRGVEIHYLIGNHDFFHRNFFTKEIGANLIEDYLVLETNGFKAFIAHGDGYVKNDKGYRILKAVLRNKFVQGLYGLIHPDFGVWLARTTSGKSRDYTGSKNYGKVDGLAETAKDRKSVV